MVNDLTLRGFRMPFQIDNGYRELASIDSIV